MSFRLHHLMFSKPLEITEHPTPGGGVYFTVADEGEFELLRPGALNRNVKALIRHTTRIDASEPELPEPPRGPGDPPRGWHPPRGGPRPLHNGVVVTNEGIPLDVRLYTPDGALFTADHVTVSDLARHRDPRGWPVGVWRYTVNGRSRDYAQSSALHETATIHSGLVEFTVDEDVGSDSAPPLVSAAVDGSRQTFSFDLYRVGAFVAEIAQASDTDQWRGSMALYDPDGQRVASTIERSLRVDIPLTALGKSRDAEGKVRMWSLQVSANGGIVTGAARVIATVLGQGRMTTAALQSRIDSIFGENGSYIKFGGVTKADEVQAELTITNPTAAEALDMFGVLDKVMGDANQRKDLNVDTPVVLYRRERDMGYGIKLDVSDIKLNALKVSVGPGNHLGADTPALRVRLETEGKIKLEFADITVADAEVRDGVAEMEVGIRIEDGVPRIVTWVPDDIIDLDLGPASLLTALLVPVIGPLAIGYVESLESEINDDFVRGARQLFADPTVAPQIMMMLFGGHFSYRNIRIEGGDVVFEYVAPDEPDPKPRKTYHEGIGRSVMIEGPQAIRFHGQLGDTWAAEKLREKVKHIVVVMMENRSYDHVLGYRALTENDGARGLTQELIDAVKAGPGGHQIRPLKQAAFNSNGVGKKTQIPKGVGHELDDVAQQLSVKVAGPGGGQINGGEGFADNFREKKLADPTDLEGCVPDDALGYYEADDLPMFDYLARNYAYSDTYYSSHPGPTLPNRMYSLTGDVQYDRFGTPILRNNHGDNFALSRARSIYDVLTQKGISWRVYESEPSVTMLRMFARHATNTVDIRNLEAFEEDARNGALPAFSYVEPAMHHKPQDDDHPDADMWRGQQFIQRVYKALRSNQDAWKNTLLIITYDEHGGLYDHVIPPIAEVVTTPQFISTAVEERILEMLGADREETPPREESRRLRRTRGEWAEELLPTGGEATTTQPPRHLAIPYGVRVPTFVVSPWTATGKGPDVCLDHCSILKTVLATFLGKGQAFLSERVAASHSFEAFLTGAEPRFPPVPGVLQQLPSARSEPVRGTNIVTPILTRRRMREEGVDFHDLSGFVARLIGR